MIIKRAAHGFNYSTERYIMKVLDKWTSWMPVDRDDFIFSEEGREMPVPPWMNVRVMSALGEHEEVEAAREFEWDDQGEYTLIFYRVTLQ